MELGLGLSELPYYREWGRDGMMWSRWVGETELTGRMKWVGGEVIEKVVKVRPGREERIRTPRAEKF
jgi:hypothetical protein